MVTTSTPLSPAANAVWEAFNQDEAGVFVDYGDKLAAALRAAADQLAQVPIVIGEPLRGNAAKDMAVVHVADMLAIAAELEGNDGPA
jgi:hypothetical protein